MTEALPVLVVEDEVPLHPIYRRIIEKAGGIADFASSGAAASAYLSGRSYACALIDKNLPDVNGLAMARSIRDRYPTTELLIVTGYANLESAIAAAQLRNCDYVVKPFAPQELADRVEAALRRYRDGLASRSLADTQKVRVQSLEGELARRADLLLQAERLATLGTLAGGVGHELNNITAVLLATVRAVKEAAQRGQPIDVECLEDLGHVGDHLKNHARHLLDLGRPGPDHVDRFDMREVVAHALEVMRSVGKTKQVDVELLVPPSEVLVTVNRSRLEQVLINVVGNAADALAGISGRVGRIRVSVWQDLPRGRAFCRVDDNGCGISKALMAKIFEPYFTTKAPGRGTGLGLPVVRQIVESYGGMLQLFSEPGVGTSVIFDVPEARIPTVRPSGSRQAVY